MRRPESPAGEGDRRDDARGVPVAERPGMQTRLWTAITRAVVGIVVAGAAAFVMLAIAVLMFLLMRGALIPKAIHEETVYFDFAPENPNINKPFASVDLLSSRKQWDATNLTFTNMEPASRALTMLQHYSIQVSMQLSHSPRNYEIGKFMLYSKLRDSAGEVLASSSRPIVVRYRSPLSLTLEIVFFWPLHLVGVLTEAQQVSVELFNNFQEGRLHPAAKVDLSLSRADPDIEYVKLSLLPQLKGLQHLFYHYRVISTLLFIGFVFVLEIALLVAFIGVRFFLSFFREQTYEEDTVLRTHSADDGESDFVSSYYDGTPASGAEEPGVVSEVAPSSVSGDIFISTAVPRPSLHDTGMRRRRSSFDHSGSDDGSDHDSNSESDFKSD